MVLVYLGSILIGRQHEVYRSLALAALLISVIWPGAVFEVSFQLSFVAVLAIFAGLSRLSGWRKNSARFSFSRGRAGCGGGGSCPVRCPAVRSLAPPRLRPLTSIKLRLRDL